MAMTTTYYDREPAFTLALTADPAELRRAYERELKEDGKDGLPDDELIAWVYEQNPESPLLDIEE